MGAPGAAGPEGPEGPSTPSAENGNSLTLGLDGLLYFNHSTIPVLANDGTTTLFRVHSA
jgi:hypothetical protein